MDKQDYYEILEIPRSASDDEIKKAYRKMAKKYHPDANPDDKEAEAKFKAVNEAYEILSDPKKKASYDQFGHRAFEQGMGTGGGFTYTNMSNMDDILESFFGGSIFGGNRRQRSGKGADLRTHISITFEEAYFGTKKDINLTSMETCDTCGGSGSKPGTVPENCRQCGGSGQEKIEHRTMFGTMASIRPCSTCRGEGKIVANPCKTCSGRGKIRKTKNLEVDIPAGIDSNQSIRLRDKGEAGDKGGPRGDLLVTVSVKNHDYFERQGSNIYLDIPITFVQAALGTEITIPTMEGNVKHMIKPGTQPETMGILKGKGFPGVKNSRIFGDLHFTLKVMVPTDLNERQKEILRDFAKEMGDEFKEKKGFFSKMKKK